VPGGPPSTAHPLDTVGVVLALHLLWTDDPERGLVLWGEDSDLPASGPLPRGRKPTHPVPRPHPFAASPAQMLAEVAALGIGTRAALSGSEDSMAVVWLPGAPTSPEPSPQLIRPGDEGVPSDGEAGLCPFAVPVLRLDPVSGLDLALVLAGSGSPDRHAGASVTTFATLAGLALEIVAAGRVLPDLRVGPGGYEARWTPLMSAEDAERTRLLAASLPPVCRSVDPPGRAPDQIVRHALEGFVDALCREALAQAPGSLVGPPRRGTDRTPPVTEAWVLALSSPSPLLTADPAELPKLERLVSEWRTGAAGGGGPWRLCLRLLEPALLPDRDPDDEADDDDLANDADADADADERGWRVDLLLQATDDLSLVVEAEEVWRSGRRLQQASRSLEAPHEVLLTELGRAVRVYPELGEALREAVPTGLELDLEGAHRFLAGAAPALELAGFGVLLPAWWRRPQARLGVRLKASSPSSGSDASGLLGQEGLCQFDWEAAMGDQRIGKAELRRLAKLKAPLVNLRGQWVELRAGEVEQLMRFLDAKPRHRRDRTMTVAEVLRVAAGTDAPASGVPVLGVSAEGWLSSLLNGELEHELDVRPTPPGFVGQLRPYQQRGVAWLEMLERLGLGACLADDMGLGKTAMVLALLQVQRERRAAAAQTEPGPTLVICPTSVVGNWAREAERFTPDLSIMVHHGTKREREESFQRQALATDIVITTYALATRDRATLAQVPWARIVLDEAQNVKNPETKQARAVRSLPAPVKVALTGTPVENHLGELWSIMEVLNPGLLGSAKSFRQKFIIPVERYREDEAAEQLRCLTRPFILRRLKTDRTIITDLPDKIEMKVLVNLTREQVTLYQAVVDEMLRRIDESEGIERKGLVLTTMLRLKQVCNHPAHFLSDGSALSGRSGKLERTTEILEEVMDTGERALVFTQFSEMGTLLVDHLSTRFGRRVAFLHGGVARKTRDAMVTEFQDPDGEIPIMVLSLKAGGTGLNLTAANHVIHFDRWWNPAVENQATDRAFRIGQRRNVQVRKLVCAGTLEDRIDQLIESKRDLAERVVGAGEGWLTELSTEELSEVFRLSAEALAA
jgi:SNF2-related domain/SNF2 Helicase protein/Helicase conserved C-terminal domain